MNAIALVLCCVIAGADARETIPTSQKLYELHNRVFEIDKLRDVTVAAEGASLQSPGFEVALNGIAWPIKGKYNLMVLPCPDEPGCFLSGYVRDKEQPEDDKEGDPMNAGSGRTERIPRGSIRSVVFALYIDVDRNILIDLNGRRAITTLPPEDVDSVKVNLEKLAQPFSAQLSGNPAAGMIADSYKKFRNEFVVPPPIEVKCEVFALLGKPATLVFKIALTAANRSFEIKDTPVAVYDLLETDQALSAEKYFAAKP